jgi:ATP/maltotriose-dependent transcriptional regulator MalT
VVSGLEQCQSLSGGPPTDDAELRHIASAVQIEAYDPALSALRRAIDALEDRPDALPPGQIARRRGAMVDLQWLLHEIEERRFDRLLTLLGALRGSLQRLRAPETTRQMLELASSEAAASCGLNRIVMFRAQANVLHVRGMHWPQDAELMEEWSAIAREHPPVLDPRDLETQLLRRRVPIIVTPDAAVGMKQLVDASRTVAYVAAPLVLNGAVVGTIHGDRHRTGHLVDTINRDVLATFADGVGGILERTAARAPEAIARADSRLLALLTPRELEVIELMAAGAHNADIAARLVISETTVISHVKQILRKMQASNRAQAASRYVRLKTMPEL